MLIVHRSLHLAISFDPKKFITPSFSSSEWGWQIGFLWFTVWHSYHIEWT